MSVSGEGLGDDEQARHSPRFKDITGMKFGRLTAVKVVGKAKGRGYKWECVCDCGSAVGVFGVLLRRGNTRSCGCLALEYRRKPKPEMTKTDAPFNLVVSTYKQSANKRRLTWALTPEAARSLFLTNCYYCGVEPLQVKHSLASRRGHTSPFYYNGIDRIDNRLGYVPGNVCACCSVCNGAKADMPSVDFTAWLARIHRFSSDTSAPLAA